MGLKFIKKYYKINYHSAQAERRITNGEMARAELDSDRIHRDHRLGVPTEDDQQPRKGGSTVMADRRGLG